MKYQPALKRTDPLTDSVWIALKGIALNELTQAREATSSRFNLQCSRETYRAVEERSLGSDAMRQG